MGDTASWISVTQKQRENGVCMGILSIDFVPSYKHGCPIWVLVLLAYYFRANRPSSVCQLSAIATVCFVPSLIMVVMTIALGIELPNDMTIALGIELPKHLLTVASDIVSEATPDIFEDVVMAMVVTSMILMIMITHTGVALWTATCLRIAHSVFSRYVRQ